MIANRVDSNQAEIVAVLRDLGATVQPLNAVKHGCPDLLVGYRGVNYLLEVKDGSKPKSQKKLTRDETKWIANWRGTVIVVESVDDAVTAITGIPF